MLSICFTGTVGLSIFRSFLVTICFESLFSMFGEPAETRSLFESSVDTPSLLRDYSGVRSRRINYVSQCPYESLTGIPEGDEGTSSKASGPSRSLPPLVV